MTARGRSSAAHSHAAWLGYLPGSLLGLALVWSWLNWGYGMTTAFYRPLAAITLAAMLTAWYLAKPFGLGKQAVLGIVTGVLAGYLVLMVVFLYVGS